MKKLIVNADDFGYNPRINQGVIAAFKNGVVTSASIIPTRDGLDDAVALAKENPKLSVGVHLDLDEMFTVDHGTGRVAGVKGTYSRDAVETEVARQIEMLLSRDIRPDHLSSHHHAHMVRDVFHVVVPLMITYGIPVMRFHRRIAVEPEAYDEMKVFLDAQGIISLPHFIEGWYWGNIDEEFDCAELMTHPGYGELWREYELLASCDSKLKSYLREKDIRLITFAELIAETRSQSA